MLAGYGDGGGRGRAGRGGMLQLCCQLLFPACACVNEALHDVV